MAVFVRGHRPWPYLNVTGNGITAPWADLRVTRNGARAPPWIVLTLQVTGILHLIDRGQKEVLSG